MHGEFHLRGFEDGKHGGGAAEVKQATAADGDGLVVAGAGTEEIAEFIVAATEPLRRGETLESPHASRAPFDAPVILLEPIILVGAGPVHDPSAEHRADCPRVGAVPVGGDPIGRDAGDGLRRAEEGLGRGHVAVLAQHGVDEIAVAVDRAIQVGPAAADLQVGFIDVPVAAPGSAPAMPAPAKLAGQCWRELRLPVSDSFMAEDDPTLDEHLGQVAQSQPVAQPLEDHEGDDVGGVLRPVQQATAALIELPVAVAAAEPAVTLGRALPPLGDGG